MNTELTILGQAYQEAMTERQEARELAAIDAMLSAFGADDTGPSATVSEDPAEGNGGDNSTEPVKAPPPDPEAPPAAVEAAASVAAPSAAPAKKARAKASGTRQPNEKLLPHIPADTPQFGSTELPKALVIGMLDTAAVNTMTKVLGDPTSLSDSRVTFGTKERISMRTDTDGRGRWKDAGTGVEGSHFHELLAHLLGVSQDRAIEVGFDLANDIDVNKARTAIERKIGKGQEAGFKSMWEAATPLRTSLAMKPLRNQLLDVRFSSCDFSDLRGDSEGRLLALHRDPQSDGAVGLTIFNPKGEAVEAFGDTFSPVALAQDWRDRSRVVIAETLRRSLYMAGFTSPILWIPLLHSRTTFPKLPTGPSKTYLVALNVKNTSELATLQTRHGRKDLKVILPDDHQVFP